jgi:hypothetical protein
MSRMLCRVMGLWLMCAVALLVPAVAEAAPGGSVGGWRSPAIGVLDLTIFATPDGNVGLESVTATLGGVSVSAPFDEPTCTSSGCPRASLKIDTNDVTVGNHDLVVRVLDANGASHEIERVTLSVERMPVFTNTVEVRLGSGQINPPGSPPPGGGVKPDAGPSCRSPRLSMRLASKPLRFRRGVPVLKRGRVYRYVGRLTCRINGRRRPAARGMAVQVRNRLRGGWTVAKPSIELRKAGEIVARLSYRSSRTVIFRVRGAGGELVRVRIPIRVVRR